MANYSWFTHKKWWFSIVMLLYQRVFSIITHCKPVLTIIEHIITIYQPFINHFCSTPRLLLNALPMGWALRGRRCKSSKGACFCEAVGGFPWGFSQPKRGKDGFYLVLWGLWSHHIISYGLIISINIWGHMGFHIINVYNGMQLFFQ